MIGFIKFVGGLSTEVVNLVLICSSFTTQDVTKDFVAMLVLAEIDNILNFGPAQRWGFPGGGVFGATGKPHFYT